MRGKGAVLRTSLSEDVTLERVRDAWSKVTDMSKAEHMPNITAATTTLMELLDTLEGGADQTGGSKDITEEFSFNFRDVILYALGGRFLLFHRSANKSIDSNDSQCISIMCDFFHVNSWSYRKRFNRLAIFIRKSPGLCTITNLLHSASHRFDNDNQPCFIGNHTQRNQFSASIAW